MPVFFPFQSVVPGKTVRPSLAAGGQGQGGQRRRPEGRLSAGAARGRLMRTGGGMTLCTEAAAAAAAGKEAAAGAGMAQRVFILPRQQSLYPPSVLNPFVHRQRLSAGDKARMIFLGIILLPLRIICIAIILLLTWPFAAIATYSQPPGGSAPLKGWKRRMIQIVLKGLGRSMFFLMGFQVTVKGKVASPLEAPIFAVAPHSSFFDGIVCVLAGLPSMVSRPENLAAPIFGRILSSLQPVLVSRQDPDSRRNTINEITKRATSAGQWPQILIFPEGTCTNRSCLITFKQGAFIPGVPVQPVLLRYPNRMDTVTWTWQGYSFKQLCAMTMCQPFTRVEVEFLPVHVPTEEEKKDPVLFANRVRNNMATTLNVPTTDHTFEDCRLMISAGQLTLPMDAGLVEFTKISKKLNLKWDHIRDQLDTYAAIAGASKGGRIGIEEFADYLKLPVSDVLRELFLLFDRLFDMDDDGIITEDEFACILQSSLGVPDLDVSKLFKEIDADETRKLSYNEFKDFALKHPEYAKLFTTYLELQRCQLEASEEDSYQSSEVKHTPVAKSKTPVSETAPVARNQICPEGYESDNLSTSDKKDD
uniref:Lysophosphatidylcholine acyltransferase 2 n=1 Tax=Crocodylus porosus TaxID=8502 RepID=A0A7M4E4V1_CROPO